MINRVRDLILNLPPGTELEVPEAEEIFEDFVPAAFPAAMERVHTVLFEGTSAASDKGFRAFQLLKLTESTEMEVYLKGLGTVSLVDTDTPRYFRDERAFDIVALDGRLQSMQADLAALESLANDNLDSEVVRTLRYLRRNHSNSIYRVGAVVTLMVLLSDLLNRKRTLSG